MSCVTVEKLSSHLKDSITTGRFITLKVVTFRRCNLAAMTDAMRKPIDFSLILTTSLFRINMSLTAELNVKASWWRF